MVIKHRKLNRLKNFDYSSSGYYYVTICTKDRECLFGDIIDNKMVLNEYGMIVKKYWLELPNNYNNIDLDEFVIMPNHAHMIVIIKNTNQSVGNDPRVVPNNDKRVVPINNNQVGHDGPTLHNNTRQQQLLFRIIQWYKTITTNIYIVGVKNNRYRPFDKRIWQRSYYDHIIRNEYSLNMIRQYILYNPGNWSVDKNYNLEHLHRDNNYNL